MKEKSKGHLPKIEVGPIIQGSHDSVIDSIIGRGKKPAAAESKAVRKPAEGKKPAKQKTPKPAPEEPEKKHEKTGPEGEKPKPFEGVELPARITQVPLDRERQDALNNIADYIMVKREKRGGQRITKNTIISALITAHLPDLIGNISELENIQSEKELVARITEIMKGTFDKA